MNATVENINKSNVLIAEFMGLVESSISNKYWTKKSVEGFGIGEMVELLYHSSWDWLMPVVEKIESLEFDFNIYTGSYVSIINTKDFILKQIISLSGSNKIEAVYKGVVEFIKWYNLQTK